jgi:hypothetical protein
LSVDPRAIIARKRFDSPTTLEVEPTDYALAVSGACARQPTVPSLVVCPC